MDTANPRARIQTGCVPLTSLHLDPANARLHGTRNLGSIVASLQRFGQAEPLVVQAGTGRVIGGNGRLEAMKTLGWTECDVVELHCDDLTATALGIALNRTAELAEWDDSVLAGLLEELRTEDAIDGVGFSTEDIDALLAELGDEAGQGDVDDPGPETPPEVPVTRPGDLWVLVRALEMSIKQERTIRGEPSDRTAVSIEEVIKREYSQWMGQEEDSDEDT